MQEGNLLTSDDEQRILDNKEFDYYVEPQQMNRMLPPDEMQIIDMILKEEQNDPVLNRNIYEQSNSLQEILEYIQKDFVLEEKPVIDVDEGKIPFSPLEDNSSNEFIVCNEGQAVTDAVESIDEKAGRERRTEKRTSTAKTSKKQKFLCESKRVDFKKGWKRRPGIKTRGILFDLNFHSSLCYQFHCCHHGEDCG